MTDPTPAAAVQPKKLGFFATVFVAIVNSLGMITLALLLVGGAWLAWHKYYGTASQWVCEMPVHKKVGGEEFYVAFGKRLDMFNPRPTPTSRVCIDGKGAKWEDNIR